LVANDMQLRPCGRLAHSDSMLFSVELNQQEKKEKCLMCREIRQELLTARKNIFPYLQAEQDMRYQTSREKWEAFEAEVMSDVEGWEVGKCVYKTRKWMPPMPKFGASQYHFE
jgi:hypothetical protein